ncbi:MAG: excinuclease ABC subunit UvrA, partial [Planctomycetota bacterium]
ILLHGTTDEDKEDYGCAFEGLVPNLKRRFSSTSSEAVKERILGLMSELPCEACGGARLKPEALAVTIGGKGVHEATRLTIDAAIPFFEALTFTGVEAEAARPVLKEVLGRLRYLRDVGLGYLTLDRRSSTLSGGEAQRIRLASQVGGGLVGVCYVLDEPTVGLHARDTARLLSALVRLRDLGNTVIVVEHDEQVLRSADHLIDVGPGAGAHGGRIVAQGTVEEVLRVPDSATARFLRGELALPPRGRRRGAVRGHVLTVRNARENNLMGIDVSVPLGLFVCVTGVSGSGKSTLVCDVLSRALARHLSGARERPGAHDRIEGMERLDKVINIDQSPIGRSSRSNPATYTGAFDEVRELFALTKEAKARGYDSGRFSFNRKGGRCEACEGLGTKVIEMHFLPDVHVTCDACGGKRYDRETLEVRFKGLSVHDVLSLRVEEARSIFGAVPRLARLLATLDEVGMGYAALGQPASMLSGGEAQRVKLAAELGRADTGRTLYILDEPTTGLHFADIRNLLAVLDRLVQKGNTVLVIEHHLEVIRSADWVIDLGPEGGDGGGRVVATGTPEEVAACPESHTGRYLRGAQP